MTDIKSQGTVLIKDLKHGDHISSIIHELKTSAAMMKINIMVPQKPVNYSIVRHSYITFVFMLQSFYSATTETLAQ